MSQWQAPVTMAMETGDGGPWMQVDQEAASFFRLGLERTSQGKLDEALQAFESAVAKGISAMGEDDMRVTDYMAACANIMRKMGRLDESLAKNQEVMAIRQRRLPAGHVGVVGAMVEIGEVLNDMNKYKEAMDIFQKAHQEANGRLAENHPLIESLRVGRSVAELSLLKASHQGDEQLKFITTRIKIGVSPLPKPKMSDDDAEDLLGTINLLRDIHRCMGNPDPLRLSDDVWKAAMCMEDNGRLGVALNWYQEALDLRRPRLGDDHKDVIGLMLQIANVKLTMGVLDAVEERRKAVDATRGEEMEDMAKLLDVD